jgi:hypothetical protein
MQNKPILSRAGLAFGGSRLPSCRQDRPSVQAALVGTGRDRSGVVAREQLRQDLIAELFVRHAGARLLIARGQLAGRCGLD